MSSEDPITNAIYGGMKRGIEVCLEAKALGSAAILIYAGIDALSFLGAPANQDHVTARDFKEWCKRYLCLPGREQISPDEWWGARCGLMHPYSTESRKAAGGHTRRIVYHHRVQPTMVYRPEVDPNLVLVSLDALSRAFVDRIDRYIVDLFADSTRRPLAEDRLKWIMIESPYSPPGSEEGVGASE